MLCALSTIILLDTINFCDHVQREFANLCAFILPLPEYQLLIVLLKQRASRHTPVTSPHTYPRPGLSSQSFAAVGKRSPFLGQGRRNIVLNHQAIPILGRHEYESSFLCVGQRRPIGTTVPRRKDTRNGRVKSAKTRQNFLLCRL